MGTKTKILISVGFLFAGFSLGRGAEAASLYFSPAEGSSKVGQTFSVSVYVSSTDQAMNAVSGTVSFSGETLEVVSLARSGSIISLWVQEPTFSNASATVKFEGIVLNPGYTGPSGKILTINFRAKSAGEARVTFSGGSVLANDGQGTNILSSLGSARSGIDVPLTGPAAEEATTAGPPGVPFAPKVSSSTHPDPNRWYANRNPKFAWSLPSGATGVNILADHNPTADPGTHSDGIFSSYSYENVEEGGWYFHIRLRNAQGWGAITHFQFQIDATPPPPFSITFVDGKETVNPKPRVFFNATDAASGIEYYKVKIGEGEFLRVAQEEASQERPYTLPAQDPGKRSLVAQAFDRAGNVTVAADEFMVLALKAPTIVDYPDELIEGEIARIGGSTYPSARVIIDLRDEAGRTQRYEVESNKKGEFLAIWPNRLKAGLYSVSAQVMDSRGAKSEFSEPRTIAVRQRAVLRIGSLVITYISVFTTLISLLLLLLAICVYGWYRFMLFRKKLKKEVREAEEMLHKAFDMLREDMRKQIHTLEKVKTKRELTKEEHMMIKRMRHDLDEAEKVVRKEIEDIEQEVK